MGMDEVQLDVLRRVLFHGGSFHLWGAAIVLKVFGLEMVPGK